MRKREKRFNYFNAFVELSKYSLKAGEFLDNTLREFDVRKISDKVKEIHVIEHKADKTQHEILNRLVREFLPPIEREDIIELSQKIDDVTDSIEDILIGIDIFNVKQIRPDIFKFTELILKCCHSMNLALIEFQNFKKSKTLRQKIIELNRLEEEGDQLYINGVRELYKYTKDPVQLMIWTEILRRIEKVYDACEDVANDIEMIVMKNT